MGTVTSYITVKFSSVDNSSIQINSVVVSLYFPEQSSTSVTAQPAGTFSSSAGAWISANAVNTIVTVKTSPGSTVSVEISLVAVISSAAADVANNGINNIVVINTTIFDFLILFLPPYT